LRQLADGQLVLANIEEDQRLNVVDIADALAVQFRLHDVQKLAVQAFDQRDSA
jgi:hypothetical protein